MQTAFSARPLSTLLALALGLGSAMWTTPSWSNYLDRPEVRQYMDELSAEHGFSEEWLSGIFAAAERRDDIIALMSRPAEKALEWHEYRRIFITEKRIGEGVEFWLANQPAIAAAEREYGVAEEVIVAIIGVETSYGDVLGRHRVIDALSTLAFDYPRRAAFFKGELTEYLLLVREEKLDPLVIKGSYAGAMGYGQFIPSSYRAYAVDFDKDGTRDIWANKTDAIGSVANYFAKHHWRGTGPAVLQVQVTDAQVAESANAGLDLTRTAGELRNLGVTGLANLADAEPAALFRMNFEDETQYWAGLHDFYVITRYNRSAMYALAVLQLSQALRARYDAASGS